MNVLLLLVTCVAACCADDSGWKWNCEPVTAQRHVDLDKVVGRWYLIELFGYQMSPDKTHCNAVDILKNATASTLIFQYHSHLGEATYRESKKIVHVVSPSQWIQDTISMVVTDFPADGSTLTTTYCSISQRSVVYSRTNTVDLGPVNDRLEKAGVTGIRVTNPKQANCPTVEAAIKIALCYKAGHTQCPLDNGAPRNSVFISRHLLLVLMVLMSTF